jgi:DNA-binding beta-propeller fold protein YncE
VGDSCEPYWVAITPNGRFLYVGNYGDVKISAYRINHNGSLTALACGSGCDALVGGEEPAITPDGKHLYLPISASDELQAYAIHQNGKLTAIACGSCATGGYPWTATLTPSGRFLYTTDAESDMVSAFRVHGNGSLSAVSCGGCTTGNFPYSLAVSPNGRHAYVANEASDTISPYRIGSDGALTSVSCPSTSCDTRTHPVAVAMPPSGRFLYAANSGSETISPFSAGNDGTLSPIACSLGCGGLDAPEYGQAIVARPDQGPKAFFTHAKAGQRVRFNARGSKAAAGQRVATYHWSFGDGHRLSTHKAKVSHRYKRAGKHKVTLTVTDNAGCSTRLIFTGQTAYCNGSKAARTSHAVSS